MDPRTLFFSLQRRFCSNVMAWGLTLGYEVPRWFNHKGIGSFGSIQTAVNVDLDDDFREWELMRTWEGYALFMVYEVHESDSYQRSKRPRLDEHGSSDSITLSQALA